MPICICVQERIDNNLNLQFSLPVGVRYFPRSHSTKFYDRGSPKPPDVELGRSNSSSISQNQTGSNRSLYHTPNEFSFIDTDLQQSQDIITLDIKLALRDTLHNMQHFIMSAVAERTFDNLVKTVRSMLHFWYFTAPPT